MWLTSGGGTARCCAWRAPAAGRWGRAALRSRFTKVTVTAAGASSVGVLGRALMSTVIAGVRDLLDAAELEGCRSGARCTGIVPRDVRMCG